MPRTAAAAPQDAASLASIMVIGVAGAICSPFQHADDVPRGFGAEWALAELTVREWYFAAMNDDDRDIALRWQLLLHDLLLRRTPRGGSRGRDVYAQRFAAFASGSFCKLVGWYLTDRELTQPRADGGSTPARTLARAVALISDGEVSKASRLLLSKGLADTSDPAIIAQLATKHPLRKRRLPGELPTRDRGRIKVALRATFRRLRSHVGTGPDGKKNQYLRALTQKFANARANGVIEACERFAEAFVNGEMPDWYYYVQSAARLVAPVKKEALAYGGTPEVRSVAMGNVDVRSWAKAVAADARGTYRAKVEPIQVACGTEGGVSAMAFAVRAHLELNPNHVAVTLDRKNAYNEEMRAMTIEVLDADPDLEAHATYFHRTYSPEGPIYFADGTLAPFTSSEGGRQGDPAYCDQFCLTTHKANVALNAELAAVGGGALFDVDDGVAMGLPTDVFAAARRFGLAIAPQGGTLRVEKCGAYSGGLGEDLASAPGYDPAFPLARDDAGILGIVIAGVPIGEPEFVVPWIERRVDGMMSNIDITCNMLRTVHLMSLNVLLYYSLARLGEYVAGHCYPSDSTGPLSRYDAGVLKAAEIVHGSPLVVHDPLLLRRMRLPAKLGGAGLRSVVAVSSSAFAGRVSQVAPLLIDMTTASGAVRPGALPGLASVFGAGSFDSGREPTRFAALLASGARLGVELGTAWAMMQIALVAAPSVLLSVPAASAGWTGVPGGGVVVKLQHALTTEIESAAASMLRLEFRALSHADLRRTAIASVDRASSRFLISFPSRGNAIANPEWRECIAMYYGTASPACAPYVGLPMRNKQGREIGRLDRHGSTLLSHPNLVDADSGRTIWHDDLLWRMDHALSEGHIPHSTEVLGIFNAALPQVARENLAAAYQSRMQRQGLVPDVVFTVEGRRALADVKTICVCPTRYPERLLRGGASQAAVRERARSVHSEYAYKAKLLDEEFAGVPRSSGRTGPVLTTLLAFGVVTGLVFGAFGEFSDGVYSMARCCATGVAQRHWRTMLAESAQQAENALNERFVREWGIANMREHARLKLERLERYVGAASPGAAANRDMTGARFKARRTAYTTMQGLGPRAGVFHSREDRRGWR